MRTIFWTCPNCEAANVVHCYPPVEAQTYGPPEICYPGEDAYIEPDVCDNCGELLDIDTILEQAGDYEASEREYAAEMRAERDREDRV